MGRPLRRHAPGTYHLITSRCQQARFLLRPDPELNDAVLEWLARAQEHWPGVHIYAVCVMSNHIHLLVRDSDGVLGAWAGYFFGNLARAVNRLRGREGQVFARRYSAEPILDADALLDRLAYVVTNPVGARLCARAIDWPGVVLWSGSGEPERKHVRRAAAWRGTSSHLTIQPFPGIASGSIRAAIDHAEREMRREREAAKRPLLGRARILAQRWRDRPRRPKTSPRPLCHAADVVLRVAFREVMAAFTAAFRAASERMREGQLDVAFPAWSYPPGRPLVRAAI